MHPVEIIAFMLIDDGDESRAQRENALDPVHQIVGINFGGHVFKRYCSVLVYWREYIDDNKLLEMHRGIYDYAKEDSD